MSSDYCYFDRIVLVLLRFCYIGVMGGCERYINFIR